MGILRFGDVRTLVCQTSFCHPINCCCLFVLAQRAKRQPCGHFCGLPVDKLSLPGGCPESNGTGIRSGNAANAHCSDSSVSSLSPESAIRDDHTTKLFTTAMINRCRHSLADMYIQIVFNQSRHGTAFALGPTSRSPALNKILEYTTRIPAPTNLLPPPSPPPAPP